MRGPKEIIEKRAMRISTRDGEMGRMQKRTGQKDLRKAECFTRKAERKC